MLMTQTTNKTTHLQATARRFMLTACTVLLMGVMGAAAIKVDERHDMPVITHAPTPLLAVAHLERPMLQPELLIDLQPAAEAKPVIDLTPTHRTMLMEVTAYCACTICCGPEAQGITASGKDVSYNDGRFVAADTSVLPFGTKLIIPGYADDQPVEVIDRGGAIKGHKLDLFYASHEEALQWGRQFVEVIITE